MKSLPVSVYKSFGFRCIFTALSNGEVCRALKELVLNYISEKCPDIDVVVGLEARGFLFNFLIASELGIGCIPIRKEGKLPGECHTVEYVKEYGSDKFQIQKNSLKPGAKVLIIDDLLATGGTLKAAGELVTKCGGTVVKAITIMELPELNGRKKVDFGVHSFLSYDA